jgi:hypothetical protein
MKAVVAARNLALESELLEISSVLRTANIEHVVLKGIPLARRLYGRLDTRVIVDNDILVRRGQVASVVDVLAGLGYRGPRQWPLESALSTNFQYPLRRERGGAPFLLEVHWAITHPLLYPRSEIEPWQRVTTAVVRGVSLPVLSPSLTAVHLAAHAAQHYYRQRRILEELGHAMRSFDVSAEDVLDCARTLELENVCRVSLWLAGVASSRDLGSPRVRAVASAIRRAARKERGAPGLLMPMLCLALAPPPRAARYVAAVAFPPRDHLAWLEQAEPSLAVFARRLVRMGLGRVRSQR